jgi:hypothetical protein
MEGRELRRLAGLLAARLPELDLGAVPDPRAREGRWSLGQIVRPGNPIAMLTSRGKGSPEVKEARHRRGWTRSSCGSGVEGARRRWGGGSGQWKTRRSGAIAQAVRRS